MVARGPLLFPGINRNGVPSIEEVTHTIGGTDMKDPESAEEKVIRDEQEVELEANEGEWNEPDPED